MEDVEIIEEELVEASGEPEPVKDAGPPESEKAETETVEKAENPVGRALFLIDKLIAGEKDGKRKQMLAEVKILLNKPVEKGCPCKQSGKAKDPDDEGIEKASRKTKEISTGQLSRITKLLSKLQELIAEADTEPGEKADVNKAEDDGLVKKLGSLEEAMGKITKALGMAEPDKDGKDNGEPTLAGTIDRLSKRLDAIEGIPAIKTSIDGQEPLAGEGKGKSMWKGLV